MHARAWRCTSNIRMHQPTDPPDPDLSAALVARLLHLFTPAQLALLIEHGETVSCPGRYGEVIITFRDGRIFTIGHQTSDRV